MCNTTFKMMNNHSGTATKPATKLIKPKRIRKMENKNLPIVAGATSSSVICFSPIISSDNSEKLWNASQQSCSSSSEHGGRGLQHSFAANNFSSIGTNELRLEPSLSCSTIAGNITPQWFIKDVPLRLRR